MKEPLKPGERPIDKRYKPGVDTGAMSYQTIPLPLKPRTPKEPEPEYVPKPNVRQMLAKKANKAKKKRFNHPK